MNRRNFIKISSAFGILLGTSGWAFYHENKLTSLGQLSAALYPTRFQYWQSHLDLIKAIAPKCKIVNIGIRPGEKLHEDMLAETELPFTFKVDDINLFFS